MGRYGQDTVIGALLAALTLAAYAPIVRNDFVSLDDADYITSNRMVQAGLTSESVAWAWTTFHASNWHPLTWMSLQLDAQLFGVRPAAFHLVNLLGHTLTTVLLFGVLRAMTGAVWRSALVAVLFGVHPLHVESVAWAAERKDVLSAFFGVLTIGLYAWYVQRPGVGRYLTVSSSFVLGLLAKPMLVTLPCVLLLLDIWPLRRSKGWAGLLLEKLPLFALAALSAGITIVAQREGGAVVTLESVPLDARLGNALTAYAGYLVKTFWPVGLAVYYPHSHGWPPTWQVVGSGLVLIAGTVLALVNLRRRPYLFVGWFWFLGTLVPVIGLIQVGDQALADRYTYLPHIGLFIAVIWGLNDLLAWFRATIELEVVLAAAAVLACAGLTWVQVGRWRDTVTLWTHTLAVTMRNYRAHANLGAALYDQGRLREAIPQLRAALAINDRDAELHGFLGEALMLQGQPDEAVAPFEAVVRLHPYPRAAHANLGTIYWRQGKLAEAESHFRAAVQLDPFDTATLNRLGLALAAKGEWHDALPHLERAVQLRPAEVPFRCDLALALRMTGDPVASEQQYRKASELLADWPNAAATKAWSLATSAEARQRQSADALRLALQACQATGRKEARYLDVLAAAQAETGAYADALATAEEARALAEAAGQTALAQAIQGRIDLYRRGQPYREPEGRRQ